MLRLLFRRWMQASRVMARTVAATRGRQWRRSQHERGADAAQDRRRSDAGEGASIDPSRQGFTATAYRRPPTPARSERKRNRGGRGGRGDPATRLPSNRNLTREHPIALRSPAR
ncbi:MAG: hypothetical protein MUC68_15470, partial [Burkholderiaceae bacterium]|nr:hypothetical protein [Burkholderiaceae bacterium]